MIISGKRDFDYDKEEKTFISLMRMIFVISALIFVWGVFSHYRTIDLVKTGKAIEGTVTGNGKYVKYATEDGRTYYVDITGMIVDTTGETIMVYYKENPAAAVPQTSILFFLIIYGISILGMGISFCMIRRTCKEMSDATDNRE